MNKSARRLAGHCNALHGDDGLWIVGVNEKSGVLGVDPDDFADWWPRLKAEFHDETPDLTEVFFTYEGKRLVALHFTTDRAPFLVRVEGGGRVEREDPWREGTSVRTARRADLLRLLVPLQRSPEIEITKANAKYSDGTDQNGASILVDLTCYMTLRLGETLVFPEHRAIGQVRVADSVRLEAPPTFVAGSMQRWLTPGGRRQEPDTGYMASADHQLFARGPGFFRISGLRRTATRLIDFLGRALRPQLRSRPRGCRPRPAGARCGDYVWQPNGAQHRRLPQRRQLVLVGIGFKRSGLSREGTPTTDSCCRVRGILRPCSSLSAGV